MNPVFTNAYLLGMAIADDLILATFDKRIGHLAGEHANQILILGAQGALRGRLELAAFSGSWLDLRFEVVSTVANYSGYSE